MFFLPNYLQYLIIVNISLTLERFLWDLGKKSHDLFPEHDAWWDTLSLEYRSEWKCGFSVRYGRCAVCFKSWDSLVHLLSVARTLSSDQDCKCGYLEKACVHADQYLFLNIR